MCLKGWQLSIFLAAIVGPFCRCIPHISHSLRPTDPRGLIDTRLQMGLGKQSDSEFVPGDSVNKLLGKMCLYPGGLVCMQFYYILYLILCPPPHFFFFLSPYTAVFPAWRAPGAQGRQCAL